MTRRRHAVATGAAVLVATLGAFAAVPRASAGLLVTANPDSYAAHHDRSLVVAAPGLLANDSGVGLTAAKATNPGHGTVTVNANGGFTYVPSPGYLGADSFTYQARVLNLGILVTDTATVTLSVTNAAPVAVADTYAARTGVQLDVPAPGVLGNDTDADGDRLTASLVDGGGSGSLDLNDDGSFSFKSGGSFTGPRTFTYRVSDGLASSATATVTINVGSTPSPTLMPTPSPTPTPAPTPTPRPTILPTLPPLPTILPVPLPTLPGSPLPSILPTRPPSGSPSASPSVSGSPRPISSSPEPSASGTAPGAGAGGSGGGNDGATGSGPGGIVVGRPDGPPIDGVDVGGLGVAGFDAVVDWAVPSLVLGVPGIVLVLAVGAQVLGGALWVPIVRRGLRGLGVRRRPVGRLG